MNNISKKLWVDTSPNSNFRTAILGIYKPLNYWDESYKIRERIRIPIVDCISDSLALMLRRDIKEWLM